MMENTDDNSKFNVDLNKKRSDYLSWEDYFMAIAFLSAQRSKDPVTQVGACIVNNENKIVGIGYNGMPIGCSDEVLPWSRIGESFMETKYAYVCHAELNAVLNKNSADVQDCIIYTTLFPCNECAKIILQSRIKEIVYYSNKYKDRPETQAAEKMFDLAGIKHRQHQPKQKQIVIDFDQINTFKPTPTGMKLTDNLSKISSDKN
ncbi:deoxycytidylate deaminase [Hydra vulgaris]|uniref:dCMP deaminase n=1 Tax=Hydra vulgaris TaxID=6087 RepID=A0ABM4D4I2_HYDVU